MKIFDWMHRMFNPGANYSQVSQKGEEEEKKVVLFEGMMERESLLLHDVLNSILTIGTLGHVDGFMSQSYDNELEDDEGGEHVEVEEVLAAPAAAAAAAESTPAVVIKESITFKLAAEGEQKKEADDDVVEGEMMQELPLLKEDRERRERGRTTLADLFAADSLESSNGAANIDGGKRGGDAGCDEKRSRKKKITKNKEEKRTSERTKSSASTANRQLQKLVTKMMMKKKKIHPEMAAAAQKAAEMHPKLTCDLPRSNTT